jgi:hypothetical protein
MDNIPVLVAWVLAVLIGLLGLIVVYFIMIGRIKLDDLLSEHDGDEKVASLAKFQFLVFTFVIALSLFVVTILKKDFPTLHPNILVLLGISGGSSLVSTGIAAARRIRLEEIRSRANRQSP